MASALLTLIKNYALAMRAEWEMTDHTGKYPSLRDAGHALVEQGILVYGEADNFKFADRAGNIACESAVAARLKALLDGEHEDYVAERLATVALRYAHEGDLLAIKRIANQYKSELGYVMYPALREALKRLELYVAFVGSEIVGFVHWHLRKDGVRTIYEIATHRDWQGKGVGKMLLNSVPAPVRLKCTIDNVHANVFYKSQGFILKEIEPGRKTRVECLG
jgi:ribosomal protein S18 acetylase RimI-like enzyme